jgi:D-arginine dehydrogenase
MSAPDLQCDVVVIGAGIAGASVAAFLAPHVRVALVEREPQAGFHTTGRSAAMFMESYGPPQVRALTRASRHYLEQSTGWLSPRTAMFVARASQAPALAALQAQLHADGVGHGSLRRLSTAQALQQVPALRAAAAHAALLDTSAADIDVHALHQHFLGCVRALGSTLHLGVALQAIQRDGATWNLEADDGRRWRAPVVVNAAGAWVDAVAALAGVAPIGIQPRRRSAFTFAPPPGMDVRGWPAVVGVDEDFYFKPSDIDFHRVAVQFHQLAARRRLALAHQLGQHRGGGVEAHRASKLTGSRRRVSGFSVVSHSCSAFISPRPLKRLMVQLPSRAPSLRSLSSAASSSPSSSA